MARCPTGVLAIVLAGGSLLGTAGDMARAATTPPPGWLTEPRVVLWEEGVKNAYPRWSRDGRKILYQSNRGGKWRLYVMDRDGSNQQALTDGTSNDSFPDWSPDNKWIAFVSDRTGNEDVWVMRADGTAPRNLTRNAARDIHPYWSPDGRTILFNSTRDAADRLQIYELTLASGRIRRLVQTPDDDTCARVSPRGDRIVYLANLAAGRDDVIIRSRSGASPVNATNDARPDGWPAWTPRGDRIVYSSWTPGGFALFDMKPDGTDRRPLTAPPEGSSDARAMVSPDGKALVFNRDRGETTIAILTVELPG